MSVFNKNFYPTPKKLIRLMTKDIDLRGADVLEPSAGKGDIADYIKQRFRVNSVNCIELDSELEMILIGKDYPVVGKDFLDYFTNTEYHAIIMNPPFENGDNHLLHAIELAEKQVIKECDIRCVLNAETIKNPYTSTRKHLITLLSKYGAEITYEKEVFTNAERKTNVEIAIIKLKINKVKNSVDNTFRSLVEKVRNMEKEDEEKLTTALSIDVTNNEVIKRAQDIKLLVEQYNYHVKLLKQQFEAANSIKYFESMIAKTNDNSRIKIYHARMADDSNFDESLRWLRKIYWEEILNTKEFTSKLTSYGKDKLEKQLMAAGFLEINIENIEMLLLAIMQNKSEMLLETSVNMFEELTRYHNNSFSKNIHYYNGWNTNDAYKINKKIILPVSLPHYWNYEEVQEYNEISIQVKNIINDLTKALQILKPDADSNFKNVGVMEFENELFKFKQFKKGTIHVWFKDLTLLDRFNLYCGRHFGWIPGEEEVAENKGAEEFFKKIFPKIEERMFSCIENIG